MPAPPFNQTNPPLYRTPVVLIAFGCGAALGFLGAIFIPLVIERFCNPNSFEIVRSQAGVTVLNERGKSIVSGSLCDLHRESMSVSGPMRFRVQLVRITDGDTIRVLWHGESVPVRLQGIDAPELKHPGGVESADCLRGLLAGAITVDLEFENNRPHYDRSRRLLAYVWHGDSFINLEMVRRRHAALYKNGGKGKYGDALRRALHNQKQK